MKEVLITKHSLRLDEDEIPLVEAPSISYGWDKQFIDGLFLDPKRWAFTQARAHAEGYDHVASNGLNYFFYREGKSTHDETSRQIACADLLAQMPALPQYTKFLGIDLNKKDLNEKLKRDIDCLGLDELETLIRTTGFVGRRGAIFGPSGVIIGMSDLYSATVRD